MNRRRVNRISAVLLAVGLGVAAAAFLLAAPEPEDDGLDDPLHNKKYVHELKVLGGQANVLAAEFQDWFAAQWQGRTLARTIAVLTLISVGAYRFVALHPDSAPEPPASSPDADPGTR